MQLRGVQTRFEGKNRVIAGRTVEDQFDAIADIYRAIPMDDFGPWLVMYGCKDQNQGDGNEHEYDMV